MGTVRFTERTRQLLALGAILLVQFIVLPRTFPIFFDGDAFFYFDHQLRNWNEILKSIEAFDAAAQYRPLGQILFTYVFYPLFKLDHRMYAAVALSFHMMNTVFVFFIVRRLLKSSVATLTATIFWGLNPVAIFVTHSFSFLADFTFAFFYFIAALCYLKCVYTGNRLFGIAALISFILSLGCKEAAITLPPVLVLITIAFVSDDIDSSVLKKRSKWILYLLFICLAIYLANYFLMKGGKFYDTAVGNNYYFNFTVQNLIDKLDYFFAGFFMPSPEYHSAPNEVTGGRRLALFTFPFVMLFLFYLLWPGVKKNHKMWFGFFLFLMFLTPVLFIRPSEFFHNIYLPVLGLGIATGIFLEDLSRILKETKWFPIEFIYIYALVIVIFSLVVNQKIFWKINWRVGYERIAMNCVKSLKKIHPTLPKGSSLYVLRSRIPTFPWYLYDGRMLNIYYSDPSLKTGFQDSNDPIPWNEIGKGKGFILAYTDDQFFDITNTYASQLYSKSGISLLNRFDQASVYTVRGQDSVSEIGTPYNAYAFLSTFAKNREARLTMVTLASTTVRFEIPVLKKESRLIIGASMAFDFGDGAEGRIYFEDKTNRTLVYSIFIDPRKPENRVWFDRSIPLGQFEGIKNGTLVFECLSGPTGNADADWFLWSQMRLEGVDQ